ncbi:MAG: hypothetical protein AAFN40_21170 [Cyanobacteria bacterium J06560_6]
MATRKRRCLLIAYLLLSILVITDCEGIPFLSSRSANAPPLSPPINAEILEHRGLGTLAKPGPWRDITQLIGYGDRLWFANSVTGINHNSADIYSYDPTTQATRYEQHLFSQDAGTPVVADGLLYWPFEDPRFSADRGEYMVTNSVQWQWRVLPQGEAFHVHTMVTHQKALFAGTGAWAAGLQRSRDLGRSWEVVYTHPTPPRQVSRLTTLATLTENLYGGFTALQSQDSQLSRWDGQTFQAVSTWPPGKRVQDLTAFDGWLYGINHNLDDSFTLWRTDGDQAEAVSALAEYRIRALAASETGLWAISNEPALLWHSANGLDWTAVHQFTEVQPLDVAVFQGQVYVGGRDQDQQGILLGSQLTEPLTGPLARSSSGDHSSPANLPPSLPSAPLVSSEVVARALKRLAPLLTTPVTYRGENTQNTLAQALLPLALSQTALAGEILSQQLQTILPSVTANLFENNVQEPAVDVAHWYILWAIGLNGQGQVPTELLTQPWQTPANAREKYWQTVPAAAWTAAQIGQDDQTTINVLVERLTHPDEPLWLKGDIVGALSVLTGQDFGYDIDAWRNWQRRSLHTTD